MELMMTRPTIDLIHELRWAVSMIDSDFGPIRLAFQILWLLSDCSILLNRNETIGYRLKIFVLSFLLCFVISKVNEIVTSNIKSGFVKPSNRRRSNSVVPFCACLLYLQFEYICTIFLLSLYFTFFWDLMRNIKSEREIEKGNHH